MKKCCHSVEETTALAQKVGRQLQPNSVICFFGSLGAGKTTFIKGVVTAAAELDPDCVSSPTFVYLNVYEGAMTVYHFDLYRLEGSASFLSMGFDEYFTAGGICCIEWSEKITALIPEDAFCITLEQAEGNSRTITIEGGSYALEVS